MMVGEKPDWPTIHPIRLCILVSSSQIGGLEKMLYHLCQNLDPRRFDLTVCLMRQEGPFIDLMVRDLKARVHLFDLSYPPKLDALWGIINLVRQTDPHIIHAFGLKGDLISRCLRPFLSVCSVASGVANPDLPHAKWKRWLNWATAWSIDAYWADCQARADLGVKRLGIPGEKIKIIYHGIDWDRENLSLESPDVVRSELRLTPDTALVVSVGNLRFIKGHQFIIEAAPIILEKCPRAVFVFVGTDLTQGALAKRAERSGIGNYFRFLGFRQDPRPYLNAADVVVQPSLSEGLPRAVLEAMWVGKPVIATKVGGIPEVIEHGVNGMVVPPANCQALADAIIDVLSHPDTGLELGRRAQAFVAERFTLDRMVKEFETFYYQLMKPVVVPA